jgi:hypothetical protein
MKDLQDFTDRYVALWNEPDPDVRRDLISQFWAADGAQVLVDPPQEIREAADRLQFPAPTLEVRGHHALEARVTRAYEMFIAPGEFVFEARGDAQHLLDNVVAFKWRMVPRGGGDLAAGGLEVMALDDDGRIRVGYLFIGV